VRRSVRGIAFVAAVLAHAALIWLLMAPAKRPREDGAEAPRMVLVFIEPEAQRIPNEALRASAPSLRLPAPNVRVEPPPPIDPGTAITPDLSPEEAPPPIDWDAETRSAAARMAQSIEAERQRKGKYAPDPRFARAKPRPEFGWDRSKTHQIEALPEGGTLIHLNDRCVLVLSGFIIPMCKLGKIPARGDLFEHMGEDSELPEEP